MEELRFGIVGLGNMGTTHARNVYGGKVPRLNLAASADIDPDRRLV